MQTMYPGQPNSPQTELASAIDDEQTTIPLLDASVLPDPPNICTIGTGEDAETVLYTGKNGNDLTGVTRGFQGEAKSWSAGTKVARNFTAYDYDALRQNVADHEAATTGVHGATSAATPNTIVQRDSAGRIKAAAPSASDDVARKAEVDEKVSKSGDTIVGELSIQAPGINLESAINLIDNAGIRKGRLFYHLGLDRVVFRKYSPIGSIAADVHFNESEFRYRVGSTYYDVWHSGNVPIETGSWTPELRFGGSTAGITYAFRAGRYTRIANVVYWSFDIGLTSKGSATGGAEIAGLPFSRGGNLGFSHAVGHANISVPSGQWLTSYISGTFVVLSTNTGSLITSAEFANSGVISASGFYFI